MEGQKYKKLCLFIPQELHKEIKISSAFYSITMKDYIIKAIVLKLLDDKRKSG